MIRARFKTASLDDYRPMAVAKHPWWCSGETDTHAIIVAYADDIHQIKNLWPEAEDIEVMEEGLSAYTFTSRFRRPEWFKEAA